MIQKLLDYINKKRDRHAVWKTAEGDRIKVKDMSSAHLAAAIKILERSPREIGMPGDFDAGEHWDGFPCDNMIGKYDVDEWIEIMESELAVAIKDMHR